MVSSVKNCQFCSYSSDHSNHLKEHINVVHLGIRKYVCDRCDYKGSTKTKLRKHREAIHEKIKNHACSQCKYKAATPTKLKMHKKAVHDKIRDHECNQCNYKSSFRFQLKEHKMRIHSQTIERDILVDPHMLLNRNTCDQCEFKAAYKSELKRHIKSVHDQNRDQECNQCEYKSSTSYQLKRHKMRIHKETIMTTTSSKCDQMSQIPSVQKETTKPPQEDETLNFEEIKKEIDQNYSLNGDNGENKCESCIEFKGQVESLRRDLAVSEKRFAAERHLRRELEQLLAQWGRMQDAREKVGKIQNQNVSE